MIQPKIPELQLLYQEALEPAADIANNALFNEFVGRFLELWEGAEQLQPQPPTLTSQPTPTPTPAPTPTPTPTPGGGTHIISTSAPKPGAGNNPGAPLFVNAGALTLK